MADLLTVRLKALIGAREVKFCSAGREDVDVRMLGTGRPFYLEFIDPHQTTLSPETLREMQVRYTPSFMSGGGFLVVHVPIVDALALACYQCRLGLCRRTRLTTD